MGKSWDRFSSKEFQQFSQEWGEQVIRVLKPGGYLLAFCGTRTYHRMVVGLEDLEDKNGGIMVMRNPEGTGRDPDREWVEKMGGKTKPVKNDITTLKPINLMRYLTRLVTPPNGTVLDPFAGSGTTGIASIIEGFNYILIEKRERFAKIITPKRIEYWSDPEHWDELKEHNELKDGEKMKKEKQNASLDKFLGG